MAIHDSVISEMRAKPYTMISLLALMGAVTFMWTTRGQYAMAADLAQVQTQLTEVKSSIQRGSLETQLRNINSELFSIQQKVTDLRAANKQVDIIYYDRVNALQNDKERLARELEKLK